MTKIQNYGQMPTSFSKVFISKIIDVIEGGNKMKFQITLKAARVNAGLTQADVASSLHRNKQTIVNWENGVTDIKMSDFQKLSELYRIPMEYMKIPEKTGKI